MIKYTELMKDLELLREILLFSFLLNYTQKMKLHLVDDKSKETNTLAKLMIMHKMERKISKFGKYK